MITATLSEDTFVTLQRGKVSHIYRVRQKPSPDMAATGMGAGMGADTRVNEKTFRVTFDDKVLMRGSQAECRAALVTLKTALIKDQRRNALYLIFCGVAAIGLLFSATQLMRPSISPQDMRNAILSMQGMPDDEDSAPSAEDARATAAHPSAPAAHPAARQSVRFTKPVAMPYKPVPVTLASAESSSTAPDPRAEALHDHNFSLLGSDVPDTNDASAFFKDFSEAH